MRAELPILENGRLCSGNCQGCASRWSEPNLRLCNDLTYKLFLTPAGLLMEAPFLMICDPPYGISLDSEWRDRAGLNSKGAAEPSYMKHRTEGHTNTSISSDTRAYWSEAFALVPSLQVAYVWHASKFTSEVLAGLLRQNILCFYDAMKSPDPHGIDLQLKLLSAYKPVADAPPF